MTDDTAALLSRLTNHEHGSGLDAALCVECAAAQTITTLDAQLNALAPLVHTMEDIAGEGIPIDPSKYDGEDAMLMRRRARFTLAALPADLLNRFKEEK